MNNSIQTVLPSHDHPRCLDDHSGAPCGDKQCCQETDKVVAGAPLCSVRRTVSTDRTLNKASTVCKTEVCVEMLCQLQQSKHSSTVATRDMGFVCLWAQKVAGCVDESS